MQIYKRYLTLSIGGGSSISVYMHNVDFLDSESLAKLLELEPVENFIVVLHSAHSTPKLVDLNVQVTSICTSNECNRHIPEVIQFGHFRAIIFFELGFVVARNIE